MDSQTELDRIIYMKNLISCLGIDAIFENCVRGCKFHISQAKKVAVLKLDAIDREDGGRIIDCFFGATTKLQVELEAKC